MKNPTFETLLKNLKWEFTKLQGINGPNCYLPNNKQRRIPDGIALEVRFSVNMDEDMKFIYYSLYLNEDGTASFNESFCSKYEFIKFKSWNESYLYLRDLINLHNQEK